MAQPMTPTEPTKVMMENVWRNNPIFLQILGICSCLAVTNKLLNTLVMCAALLFTCVGSNMFISMLRNVIPNRIRMVTEVLVIAVFVTIVDLMLKGFLYDISKQLGPYVGLIITNCIIMGRCEVFAMKNGVWLSFWDGVGAGIGYTIVLVAIAIPRELLGFGTILGIDVLGKGWISWNLMIMPPGAFLFLGLFIWIARSLCKFADEEQAA